MLLQINQRFSDEVTISSLPHPISMFMLGFTLFAMLLLYIEYKRTKSEFSEVRKRIDELNTKLEDSEIRLDSKLNDISKKVDSRVDKAILSIKKLNQN
jgi:tetrahydromethanopterin S-methyltransferase subunit G